MAGILYIVGIGPGNLDLLAPRAANIIQQVEVVVGYRGYLNLLEPILDHERQRIIEKDLSHEIERATWAIRYANQGYRVALVSSGDAGVYGMAGVVFEWLSQNPAISPPPIEVIPGISAIHAAAARVGAPIMHDFAAISLSDLMTPWPQIVRRLHYAAQGDFVVALYNPRSAKRPHQIEEVKEVFLHYRDPHTPVAVVRNVYRDQESIVLSDLTAFLDHRIDMFTMVLIGNSRSFVWNKRVITPRGYYDSMGKEPHVLILGGTMEGRYIAERLALRHMRVTLSYQKAPSVSRFAGADNIRIRTGGFDYQSLAEFVDHNGVGYIVDMTHPDAQVIRRTAKQVSEDYHTGYVRYRRPVTIPDHPLVYGVNSHEEAANIAATMSGTVFLAIGTKFLKTYADRLLSCPGVFPVVRLLPSVNSLRDAETLGFSARQVIAMMGPISPALNRALYEQYHVRLIVVKAGTYDLHNKVEPALEQDIPVVVVNHLSVGDPAGVNSQGADAVDSLAEVERQVVDNGPRYKEN